MKRIQVALMLGVLFLPAWSGAEVFDIPDGNYAQLRQAISDANANSEADVILLAAYGTYRPSGELALEQINTRVKIYGQGATIDGSQADGGRPFHIGAGGELTVADLDIRSVSYTVSQAFHDGGVIRNDGTLQLRNVSITGTRLTVDDAHVFGPVISNSGGMRLVNVTLSDNRTTGDATSTAIHNAGQAFMQNSTVVDNRTDASPNNGDPAAVVLNGSGELIMSNSIIAANPRGNCSAPIISDGGNLDDDDSCGLNEASDHAGTDPQLGVLADHGGGLLTHSLPAGSPAVDAGRNFNCMPMDARGQPRSSVGGRGTGNSCDAGAFERVTGNSGFSDAATGSWFDPEQSGHGYMVEILDGNLLLFTWFVFDSKGNRDWVQALGPYRDGIAKLTAYQVVDGAFPPGFDSQQTSLRYWGTVSLVMHGCTEASTAWMPDVQGYPEGGMPLARLTGVSGLDCP